MQKACLLLNNAVVQPLAQLTPPQKLLPLAWQVAVTQCPSVHMPLHQVLSAQKTSKSTCAVSTRISPGR